MKKRLVISGSLVFVALLLFAYGMIYFLAHKPVRNAHSSAEEVASTQFAMREFDSFYYYNGNEAWDVVTGTNSDGEAIGVWISRDGDEQLSLALDGLTEKEAITILRAEKDVWEIKGIRLGMESEAPLWEITYLNKRDYLCYYYMDYYTGKVLKSFDNVAR